jgi:thiol-disulfide isomerase/thioredoxin
MEAQRITTEIVRNIPIRRMDCPTCVLTLEKEIKKIPGVKDVTGNYLKKTIRVIYTEPNQLISIEKVIEDLGYEITYKKYPSSLERIKEFFNQGINEIQPLTDKDFHSKVLNSTRTTAVLFGSKSCPACQVIKPKLNQLATKYRGNIEFFEMDVEYSESWKSYDVIGIPVVIVLKMVKSLINSLQCLIYTT